MAKSTRILLIAVALAVSSVLLVALPPTTAHYGVSVDVETCTDLTFESDLKYSYLPGEPVYVRGKTENFSQTLDIYLVSDIDWVNGQVIPTRIAGTLEHVVTNGTGYYGPYTLWAAALPGKYDICIDTNNNGIYNPEKDALWDNNVQVTAGFFVVPEYPLGALLAFVACLAAFVVIKRRNH